VGTPFLPPLEGTILVLEDIHETPQSLDRMTQQIRLSGVADGIAGIVLGRFTECVPRSPGVTEEEGREVVRAWGRSHEAPLLEGFPYGHEPLCCALPFGTAARLETDPPGLRLLGTPLSPPS
jgi:muramoyltetrapeptide carboxypeptidase